MSGPAGSGTPESAVLPAFSRPAVRRVIMPPAGRPAGPGKWTRARCLTMLHRRLRTIAASRVHSLDRGDRCQLLERRYIDPSATRPVLARSERHVAGASLVAHCALRQQAVHAAPPCRSRSLDRPPRARRCHRTRPSLCTAWRHQGAVERANPRISRCANRPMGTDRPCGGSQCHLHPRCDAFGDTGGAPRRPRSTVAATPRQLGVRHAGTERRSRGAARSVGGAGRRVVAGATALARCRVGAPPHRSSRSGRSTR